MVSFRVFKAQGKIRGFEIKGHANEDVCGKDIVCAAVSSAAYLAVNTLTDEFGIAAQAQAEPGSMYFMLPDGCESQEAQAVLNGLVKHIKAVSCDYPHNLKVIYGGL